MPHSSQLNETASRGPALALPGVQVLRALAALLVVVHHAELNLLLGFNLGNRPLFDVGSIGVDIFFLISGFIMLVSSRRLFAAPNGSMAFLGRRLVRIVPLYWAVTTIYVAGYAFAPGTLGRTVSLGTVASSYLFWPFIGLDGHYHPVLVVGWTLNYEMFFYCLFAAAMVLRREWAIAVIIGSLAFTIALATWMGGWIASLGFWGQPIILEFAAGIAVAAAYERRWFIPRPAAALAICCAVGALAWQIGDQIPSGWNRLLVYGVPALLLVGGVVLAAPSDEACRLPRMAIFLGDASYSLYLVHLMALTIMRIVAIRLGFAPTSTSEAILFVLISLAASICAAAASYLLFEKPVTDFLRAKLDKRPIVPADGFQSSSTTRPS